MKMTMKLLVLLVGLTPAFWCTVVSGEDPGSITGFPTNVVYNYDANGNGFVSSEDATAVITHLNSGAGYDVFKDVNFDGFNTPIDALIIINALNRNPWQNFTNNFVDKYDVNNSNSVSPIDALQVVNRINGGASVLFKEADADKAPYYDADGNDRLTSNDANTIIVYLNSL